MLVLLADKFPAKGREALEDLGVDVVDRPELGADDLPRVLRETDATVLVVRSTRVTQAAFQAASPQLALVIRAGAGVNTIDLAAASQGGVFVANCPGKNSIAVAELTMGLLLALDRHIPDAVAEMRAGQWNKKRFGKATGLFGRRMGLVGFGSIAREVAQRARAFGMHVSAYSRSLLEEDAAACEVRRAPSLDALLQSNDIISVHVPYADSTRHLIGAREIGLLPPGAILLHTARGGVVDDAALADAVRAGKIRAGLDVYEDEPSAAQAPYSSPFRELAAVYTTPHIAASTEQAEQAIADEVVRLVGEYCTLGTVRNTVNIVMDRPARWTVVVRHLDRVGVLASVLGAMREEQLNVQEVQNIVFSGNTAASASLTLEREPSRTLIERLRAQDNILSVVVREVVRDSHVVGTPSS